MQFTTTSAVAQSGGKKIVVYGLSGVGKTRLARTIGNSVIISAENGLLSLAGDNIPAILVSTPEDVIGAYKWLLADAGRTFTTVFVDSISDIAEVAQRGYMAMHKDIRKAIGESNQFIFELIRNFRDMPHNVVFIAKESSKTGTAAPMLPSSGVTDNFSYYFDVVARMKNVQTEEGKTASVLQCVGSFDTLAKDRSGKLAEIEPANISHIIRKLTS